VLDGEAVVLLLVPVAHALPHALDLAVVDHVAGAEVVGLHALAEVDAGVNTGSVVVLPGVTQRQLSPTICNVYDFE
jgi:hypothetical protein